MHLVSPTSASMQILANLSPRLSEFPPDSACPPEESRTALCDPGLELDHNDITAAYSYHLHSPNRLSSDTHFLTIMSNFHMSEVQTSEDLDIISINIRQRCGTVMSLTI